MQYLLTTNRLGLRNWQENDLAEMIAINQDAKVMEFFPGLPSPGQTRSFVARMQIHFAEHGFCYFAVDRFDKKEFIGFIGLLHQHYYPAIPDMVDIGWRLKKDAWNNGFATEGAKACLEFGFNEIKLNDIYSVAPLVNLKSQHIMQKIGMEKINEFNHPKLTDHERLRKCALYVINKDHFFK